jgi:hypothetical protein
MVAILIDGICVAKKEPISQPMTLHHKSSLHISSIYFNAIKMFHENLLIGGNITSAIPICQHTRPNIAVVSIKKVVTPHTFESNSRVGF